MSETGKLPGRGSPRKVYEVTTERLKGTNTDLASFSFNQGANLYVFSYQKEGVRRHTFIDSGDSQYRNQILAILTENDINPASIERILITHRHPDHCGLASILAGQSGAKISVHPAFRSFIEGQSRGEEQRWMGDFDPSQLREHNIEYLPQLDSSRAKSINGVDFPRLGELIEIGEGSKLEILGCPESQSTHSPDQIIVLYSPENSPLTSQKTGERFLPTDNLIFSGDLWLMTGPIFSRGLGHMASHLKHNFSQMRSVMSNASALWRDPRAQDAKAKEALKTGFDLIRVKPGHGKEFLGSKIIPRGLLADRDLLMAFGYGLDTDKAILKGSDLAPRVATLREQAYASFVSELHSWRDLGYDWDEISKLLVRTHQEQSGGGGLVARDRRERRARLKTTLARLRDDKAAAEELHQLAESTLLALKRV